MAKNSLNLAVTAVVGQYLRVTVHYYPLWRHRFCNIALPAQRFWWQTVSLLDVMWPRSNQWERALREKNSSYITIHVITSNGCEHYASNARQFTFISFSLGILEDSAIPTSYVGPVGDTKRQLDLSIPEATSTPSKVSTPRRRCGALTRTGSACKNVIAKGSLKCRRHSRMESSFIPDEC